jgi:hypothetical protein
MGTSKMVTQVNSFPSFLHMRNLRLLMLNLLKCFLLGHLLALQKRKNKKIRCYNIQINEILTNTATKRKLTLPFRHVGVRKSSRMRCHTDGDTLALLSRLALAHSLGSSTLQLKRWWGKGNWRYELGDDPSSLAGFQTSLEKTRQFRGSGRTSRAWSI